MQMQLFTNQADFSFFSLFLLLLLMNLVTSFFIFLPFQWQHSFSVVADVCQREKVEPALLLITTSQMHFCFVRLRQLQTTHKSLLFFHFSSFCCWPYSLSVTLSVEWYLLMLWVLPLLNWPGCFCFIQTCGCDIKLHWYNTLTNYESMQLSFPYFHLYFE